MNAFERTIANVRSVFANMIGSSRPDDAKDGLYVQSMTDATIVATAREYKPADIEALWRTAEKGDTQKLLAFYDEMRARDPHLDAELRKAELMIVSGDMDVAAWPPQFRDEEDASAEAMRSRAVADYVREQFFNPSVRALEFLRHLATGLWKMVAGAEVVATPGAADGRERLDALVLIPAQRFWWPKGEMRLHFQWSPSRADVIPIEDIRDQVVVLTVEDEVPNVARRGLLRRVMTSYLVRQMSGRWWNLRVEKEGQPTRVGKVPPGYHAKDEVKAWLKNMGAEPWAVFEKDVDIVVQESSQNSEMHQRLVDFHAREISKIIHGGSQLADVQRGTGSHNNAQTQEAFAWELAEGRFHYIAALVRDRLFRYMVERNFGPEDADKYTPELISNFEDPTDVQAFSAAVKNLNDSGVDLTLRWIYKGIGDSPKDGEPMLKGKAPAAPVPLGPDGRPLPPPPPSPSGEDIPPKNPKEDPNADPAAASVVFEGLAHRLLDRMEAEGIAASQRRAGDDAAKIAVKAKAGAEIVAPIRDVIRKGAEEDVTMERLWQMIRHAHTARGRHTPRLEAAIVSARLTSMMEGLEAETKKRAKKG
jgi:hypothetical protein